MVHGAAVVSGPLQTGTRYRRTCQWRLQQHSASSESRTYRQIKDGQLRSWHGGLSQACAVPSWRLDDDIVLPAAGLGISNVTVSCLSSHRSNLQRAAAGCYCWVVCHLWPHLPLVLPHTLQSTHSTVYAGKHCGPPARQCGSAERSHKRSRTGKDWINKWGAGGPSTATAVAVFKYPWKPSCCQHHSASYPPMLPRAT